MDPCTPKGYLHDSESWRLSPGLHDEKSRLSTLQSEGNFSECRSAALMMLQKGKGENCSLCYIVSFYNNKSSICLFFLICIYLRCREVLLSALLYRINFPTKAPGEIFGNRKFLPHIRGLCSYTSSLFSLAGFPIFHAFKCS